MEDVRIRGRNAPVQEIPSTREENWLSAAVNVAVMYAHPSAYF